MKKEWRKMRKVYCDMCDNEFDNSVLSVADGLYINKAQKISIELNVPDNIDICDNCRARILNAAKGEGKKIMEDLENDKVSATVATDR